MIKLEMYSHVTQANITGNNTIIDTNITALADLTIYSNNANPLPCNRKQ